MPSSLSITPRWEGKWFEVAMPFVLFDNYNAFAFGIAGRIGPLFLGTDNLGSFLNINKPRSTDIYFGLFETAVILTEFPRLLFQYTNFGSESSAWR